jgi:ribosome-binding factor A
VSIQKVRKLCDTLGPDDGLDPRLDRSLSPQRRATRKARQLCAAVERTLQSVLTGECGDDLLRELTVESVVPAPHAGRLLVTLRATEAVEARPLLDRLHAAAGMLRCQVAAAVHRQRAPELAFRLAVGEA